MGSSDKQTSGIGAFLSGLSNRVTEPQTAGDLVTPEYEQLISAALIDSPDVTKVIRVFASPLADGAVLVAAKVDVAPELTMRQVSVIVNLAERRVRAALPEAAQIFIVPDIWVDPEAAQPTTSAIVMLSGN